MAVPLTGCAKWTAASPRAEAGTLDLRSWDFTGRGIARLDGEWAWYWQRWIAATPLSQSSVPPTAPTDGYFSVPQLWKGKQVHGETLGSDGYATFRLRVLMPTGSQYAILAKLCSSAFRLFWNGREIAASGVLGTSRRSSVPGCLIRTPALEITQAENILTVQISNYHHTHGGFRTSLLIGLADQIVSRREHRIFLDAFICGALCHMLLYCLTNFFLIRRNTASLYLGLFCLLTTMWISMQGALLLPMLFPRMSWELLMRIEYIGLYLAPVVFGRLLRSSYPREAPRWLFDLFTVMMSSLALSVLVLPTFLFTRQLGTMSILIFLFSVICLIVSLRSAARRRNESIITIIGFVPLCMGVLYDSFSVFFRQSNESVTPPALMLMLFIQAFILSRRSAHAQELIEEQAHTLLRLNAAYYRFVPKEFLRLLGKDDIMAVQISDQVQREMTVLFADVRDFTSLSERMSPQDTFAFVNGLLGRIGPLIRAHGGFIDKYMGDGIMALFPRRPDDAVRAALEMCRALAVLNQQRQERGEVEVRMGIGIHMGSLMLGTVGEPERMDGTVISDVVNTASRLQSLSKVYGVVVLLSEQVVAGLAQELRLSCRVLGRVRAKGKRQPVIVHEFFAGDPESVAAEKRDTRPDFESGLACYQAGDFVAAATCFDAVCTKSPADSAARYYQRRVTELGTQPPGAARDWDGIEDILEK